MTDAIAQWTGAILLLLGVSFTLIAAIGLVRLPDLYSRTHAATKPQLLGLTLVCAGICVEMWDWHWVVLSMVILGLQVVTAPVGSHLVGRAIYRTGRDVDPPMVVDELSGDLDTSSLGDGS